MDDGAATWTVAFLSFLCYDRTHVREAKEAYD